MIDPLWLLLVGMIVVLGGILLLRLHAFLALILGALIVASLTTSAASIAVMLLSIYPAPPQTSTLMSGSPSPVARCSLGM